MQNHPPQPSTVRARLFRVAGMILALLLSALIIVERDHLAALQEYGYLGVFLVSVLSSATVFVPAPGLALTFASGDVLNPLLVGLVAGVGEALGELTGYLAGASGRGLVEERPRLMWLTEAMRRPGGLIVVFALSAIPNPVFDVVGILAGALRYPLLRFLLVCAAGKFVKGTVVALLGARLG